MKVRVKKLSESAVIPKYAKPGDAGMDLTAISCTYENGVYTYSTGLAFEVPEGYVGLIFPRSSVYKKNLYLTNCVGVLDSGYRGEVCFKFRRDTVNEESFSIYKPGDRIGQILIVPYPKIELEEVEELSESLRGEGGFGSTGI